MIDKMLRSNNLTPTDETLNNFFLKNINRIGYITIYDVSKSTYISTSSIVRYCKKLGATGFKDFKLELMNSLIQKYNMRFDNSSQAQKRDKYDKEDINLIDMVEKLRLESIQGLNDLKYSLNAVTLNKIASLLLKSKKIYGIGVGNSFIKLQALQFKLLKLGISIDLINYQSEQFYLAYHSTTSDVALVISYSGTTAEIVNDSKIFNSNQTPIIAITANDNCYLARNSKILLKIPKEASTSSFESELAADLYIQFMTNSIYLSILKQLNIKQLCPTPISRFNQSSKEEE